MYHKEVVQSWEFLKSYPGLGRAAEENVLFGIVLAWGVPGLEGCILICSGLWANQDTWGRLGVVANETRTRRGSHWWNPWDIVIRQEVPKDNEGFKVMLRFILAWIYLVPSAITPPYLLSPLYPPPGITPNTRHTPTSVSWNLFLLLPAEALRNGLPLLPARSAPRLSFQRELLVLPSWLGTPSLIPSMAGESGGSFADLGE